MFSFANGYALPAHVGSVNFIQFDAHRTRPSLGDTVDTVSVKRTAAAPAYCLNLNFAVTFPAEFVMVVLANEKKKKPNK